MRRWLMVAVVAALTTSGCSRAPQLQDVGLPGSRVQDGYEISAVFDDVLDLVPLATVKLDGVKVGVVSSVELADDYAARAVLTIEPDAEIPRQATASIEQTSLLGEKYIELESPAAGPPDAMREGEVIPLSRTGAGVEVETLLSGASALLNGGGIGQPVPGAVVDQCIIGQRHGAAPTRAARVAMQAQAQRLKLGADLPIGIGGKACARGIIAFGRAVQRDRARLRRVIGTVAKPVGAREIANARRRERQQLRKGTIDPRPRSPVPGGRMAARDQAMPRWLARPHRAPK